MIERTEVIILSSNYNQLTLIMALILNSRHSINKLTCKNQDNICIDLNIPLDQVQAQASTKNKSFISLCAPQRDRINCHFRYKAVSFCFSKSSYQMLTKIWNRVYHKRGFMILYTLSRDSNDYW